MGGADTDLLTELFGYDVTLAGRVSSVTFIASACGLPLAGALLDRHGRLASAYLAGVTLELVGTAALLTGLLGPSLSALVTAAGKIFAQAAFWPAVARLAPPALAGRAVGLVVLAQNTAMAAGPPLSGVLRDWTGTYRPVLVLWCGGLCASMLAAAAVLYRDRRTHGQPLESRRKPACEPSRD